MFGFKTLPLKDNTQGFRFDGFGTKGIYRKRALKKRYGVTSGDTFNAFHWGKRSLYVEQFKPRRALSDWALKQWAIAYKQVFQS